MAEITTTQVFSDGDTVTAAKLNNILGNASISSEIITNRSELTIVDGSSDFVLGYDTSAASLRKIKPTNIISDSSISTNKIANLSVTTGKLDDLAVTTGKIGALAVTTEKIADNSITTAKIIDASITTSKINNNAITSDKVLNGSIGTSKMAALAPSPEGTYGGSTSIPTIVVNSRGQVTSVTSSSVSAGGPQGMQVFTSSGTFTVPSGVTKLKLTCVGGGGGGGGYSQRGSYFGSGGSGGGGGASEGVLTVTSGQTISVTIGAGGGAGGSLGSGGTAGSGASGGSTIFDVITAGGGGGGGGGYSASNGYLNGGAGSLGGASGGSLNLSGMYGSSTSLAIGSYGSGGGQTSNGVSGIAIVEW